MEVVVTGEVYSEGRFLSVSDSCPLAFRNNGIEGEGGIWELEATGGDDEEIEPRCSLHLESDDDMTTARRCKLTLA